MNPWTSGGRPGWPWPSGGWNTGRPAGSRSTPRTPGPGRPGPRGPPRPPPEAPAFLPVYVPPVPPLGIPAHSLRLWRHDARAFVRGWDTGSGSSWKPTWAREAQYPGELQPLGRAAPDPRPLDLLDLFVRLARRAEVDTPHPRGRIGLRWETCPRGSPGGQAFGGCRG